MAAAQYGKDFCVCDAVERDDIIRAISRVPHPLVERFFLMLVRLTIAGFLCEPRYGGNRDEVGWQFLGCRPDRRPA